MREVYVLDGNLRVIDLVDDYKSLIWTKRYQAPGDCEIYVGANSQHVASLIPGRYIIRTGDDIVFRIVKVELQTNADEGDYLIVAGQDMSALLDQRIIWGTAASTEYAEDFIRSIVQASLIDAGPRKILTPDDEPLVALAAAAGFTEELNSQISYRNIGEVTRELCRRFGWGYKMYLYNNVLRFALYKGSDLSSSVIFSEDYGNVISSDYLLDATAMSNVALVAGSGEGSARSRDQAGTATGIGRYEIFIDAKNTSNEITFKELTDRWPLASDGGPGSIVAYGSKWAYHVTSVDLQIYDADQLSRMQAAYPGGMIVLSTSGQQYYRVSNVNIADLDSDTPADTDTVRLRDIVYKVYLVARGYEALAGFGERRSFSAEIEPNELFTYGVDYQLGDIVGIQNKYGINVSARIAEVIEYDDDTGYHVSPTLEYIV